MQSQDSGNTLVLQNIGIYTQNVWNELMNLCQYSQIKEGICVQIKENVNKVIRTLTSGFDNLQLHCMTRLVVLKLEVTWSYIFGTNHGVKIAFCPINLRLCHIHVAENNLDFKYCVSVLRCVPQSQYHFTKILRLCPENLLHIFWFVCQFDQLGM